jgi:hypothetical protein
MTSKHQLSNSVSFFAERWVNKGGISFTTNGESKLGSLTSSAGSFFGLGTGGGSEGVSIAIASTSVAVGVVKATVVGLVCGFACDAGTATVVLG